MATVRSSLRGKPADETAIDSSACWVRYNGRIIRLLPMSHESGKPTWFLNLGGGMEFDDLDTAREWMHGYRKCGAQRSPGHRKSYDLEIHPHR